MVPHLFIDALQLGDELDQVLGPGLPGDLLEPSQGASPLESQESKFCLVRPTALQQPVLDAMEASHRLQAARPEALDAQDLSEKWLQHRMYSPVLKDRAHAPWAPQTLDFLD